MMELSTRAVGSGLHQFSKSGVEWSHGVLEGLGSLYAAAWYFMTLGYRIAYLIA